MYIYLLNWHIKEKKNKFEKYKLFKYKIYIYLKEKNRPMKLVRWEKALTIFHII